MIIAIRISGLIGVPKNIKSLLYRMRLRKKYSAVLVKPTEENMKILRMLRNHIAFGDINEKTLVRLIDERAKPEKKVKLDAKKVTEELKKKRLENLGIKPFFRLHSPRGGIDSKKHFGIGKGVLGDNKKSINNLVERML